MMGKLVDADRAPCVSIVMTTFNRAELLAGTIESILCQNYADFELIIVDNMSADDTQRYVISLADRRIRYFRNPNHGVIAVNRNFGIQQAKGRYIAFSDDDDLWLSDKLRRQVALLDQQPEVALCYTNAESFCDNRIIKKRMVTRTVNRNHFFHLLRGNYIPNSSVVMRSTVFQELGMLTIDATLREDYEMWMRVARRYPLAGIDESLIRYRVHLNNVAGNRAAETLRAIRSVRSVVKKLQLTWLPIQFHLTFQYAKYCIYQVIESSTYSRRK